MQVRFIMILHARWYNYLRYTTLHYNGRSTNVSKYKPIRIGKPDQLIQVRSFISVFLANLVNCLGDQFILLILLRLQNNHTRFCFKLLKAFLPKHLLRICQTSGLFFGLTLLALCYIVETWWCLHTLKQLHCDFREVCFQHNACCKTQLNLLYWGINSFRLLYTDTGGV